jgi:hypothetical protein
MRSKKPDHSKEVWGIMDLNDPAAVDRFVTHAIEAGRRAGTEAVWRLLAAGIAVPYADGNGGVAYRFPRMTDISPIEVRSRKGADKEPVEMSLVEGPPISDLWKR